MLCLLLHNLFLDQFRQLLYCDWRQDSLIDVDPFGISISFIPGQ